MPTYVYQCEKCGLVFERRQHFTDAPLTQCPECDGHVHRVLQPVGIIFKGPGFYVTDNRAKSPTSVPGNGTGAKAGESKAKAEVGSAESSAD